MAVSGTMPAASAGPDFATLETNVRSESMPRLKPRDSISLARAPVLRDELAHLRMDEGGMWIEAGEHTVEGLIDETVVTEFVEIRMAGTGDLQDFYEALQAG